jgi:PAS domain S-box-containing protein
VDSPAHPGAIGAALGRNAHIAVIYATATGHIAFWNTGAEALFGYSPAEVAGHRVDLIVPPELRDLHWAGFNRTIGSTWRGAESWGAVEAIHKSGARVPAEVLLTPIYGADGRVESVLGMFRRPATSA